jgi:hypothetical protein
MPEFDSWFSDNELERCPNCGQRKLVREEPARPLRLCLQCGIVEAPDVDAHRQSLEPPHEEKYVEPDDQSSDV